jgi:hypothetical protein
MTFGDIEHGDVFMMRYNRKGPKGKVYKRCKCVGRGASYVKGEVLDDNYGPDIVDISHDGYVYGEDSGMRMGVSAEVSPLDFEEVRTQ